MIIELNQIKATEEDNSLKYTKEILIAIKAIQANHNKEYSQKVRLSQLIDVFLKGESDQGEEALLIRGFSRIFSFLDLVTGATSFNKESFGNIKMSHKQNRLLVYFECSSRPDQQHIEKAKQLVEKFNLNFSIPSFEHLYFSSSCDSNIYEFYI